jgi:hypothetical protein
MPCLPSSPGPFSLRAKGRKLFFEVPLPEGEGFRVRAKVKLTIKLKRQQNLI